MNIYAAEDHDFFEAFVTTDLQISGDFNCISKLHGEW